MRENIYAAPLGTIRTFTGKYASVFDPRPEMFCIEDIAHALSMIPRYTGHTRYHYSVAHHSIECAHAAMTKMASTAEIFAALMHDSSEAYLTDIASPIKARMPEYYAIEDNLMHVLAYTFGFQYPLPEVVKEVDRLMLEREWEIYMLDGHKPTTTAEEAEKRFLKIYHTLKSQL